ncbi:MAG: papain-like cysteine protease family protein [Bacteroidota bacterium]
MKKAILIPFVLLLFVTGTPTPLFSQNLTCNDYNGRRTCTAGLLSSVINARGFDTQQMNQWCWAASIQAVFSYYGHRISQQRIVAETFGSINNWPGSANTILNALNRTWTDDSGRSFYVTGVTYSANSITASQDLAADHPLIIGTNGHAMVLTALTYWAYLNNMNQVWVQNARVRDPWPTNARTRDLTLQEWQGVTFLARIRVQDL